MNPLAWKQKKLGKIMGQNGRKQNLNVKFSMVPRLTLHLCLHLNFSEAAMEQRCPSKFTTFQRAGTARLIR